MSKSKSEESAFGPLWITVQHVNSRYVVRINPGETLPCLLKRIEGVFGREQESAKFPK